jgi:hypothetical protein
MVEIPYITTCFELTVQAARTIATAPGWLVLGSGPTFQRGRAESRRAAVPPGHIDVLGALAKRTLPRWLRLALPGAESLATDEDLVKRFPWARAELSHLHPVTLSNPVLTGLSGYFNDSK